MHKDQKLKDQKRIIREEFLEELSAFEATVPVEKVSIKALRKRRKWLNIHF